MEIINLLLLLAVIWFVGSLFKRIFGTPRLLGELVAGLIFGPTILGMVHPSPELTILAELGIFFLMFHSGLETDPQELKRVGKKSICIAIGGMVIPFALGYYLINLFGGTFHQSLFMGMALSITAIAVTAKVLKETGLNKTKLGHAVMGAAVIDDILSLILLSTIIGIVKFGAVNFTDIIFLMGKVTLFFVVTILVGYKVYPLFKRIFASHIGSFTFALIMAFVFAFLAEKVGLHLVVGAYVAGLFVREEVTGTKQFKFLEDRFFALSYGFLGPIFFATLAFNVKFSVFQHNFPLLIAIISAAIIGKLFGAGICAFASKFSKTESLSIGVLMSGRCAIELVIAAVGFSLGILDETLLSILVFMAFFTTFMVPIMVRPLAKRLHRNYKLKKAH